MGIAKEKVNQIIDSSKQLAFLRYIGIFSAVTLSLFHLYTAYSGIFITAIVHYAIHFLLISLIFLTISKPLSKKSNKLFFVDVLLLIITLFSLGYVIINYFDVLSIMGPSTMTSAQKLSASLILILTLYLIFIVNKSFFVLSIIMLGYGFLGNYLTGPFQHAGISLNRLTYLISYSTDGIFGVALAISATYLFIFIFFGVVLEKTGTGDLILRSSQALVGRYAGGSAKIAVLASAGMGSIVGSSIGNVVSTGSLTIPVMRESGFRPHVAGAIEAVASEGGQILPPVMGAGAFIMASLTGIAYADIVIASIIPAILYFLSVYMLVDFEAKKFNILGLSKEQLPKLKLILKEKGHLFISILVLIYLLLFYGMGVMKAGFYSILSLILLTMLKESTRLTWSDLFTILKEGAIGAVEIAIICAAMGIITGIIIFTGVGARLSEIIVQLSGGGVFFTLVAGMLVAVILGMGLPTPVAYLMAALFVAPALVEVGVPVLGAHLFLFYFAVKSGTTPPISIVAVVASSIAQANWFRTALVASWFSLPSFIIAYAFIYHPGLLLNDSLINIIISLLISIVAIVGITGGLQGWWIMRLNLIKRIFLAGSSAIIILPDLKWSLSGILGLVLVSLYQYFLKHKRTEIIM